MFQSSASSLLPHKFVPYGFNICREANHAKIPFGFDCVQYCTKFINGYCLFVCSYFLKGNGKGRFYTNSSFDSMFVDASNRAKYSNCANFAKLLSDKYGITINEDGFAYDSMGNRCRIFDKCVCGDISSWGLDSELRDGIASDFADWAEYPLLDKWESVMKMKKLKSDKRMDAIKIMNSESATHKFETEIRELRGSIDFLRKQLSEKEKKLSDMWEAGMDAVRQLEEEGYKSRMVGDAIVIE